MHKPLHKPRLKRLDLVYTPNPIYFITTCTFHRARCLDCGEVHRAFVAFCDRATERHVFVGNYVLMPDHLHLFVAIQAPDFSLSTWIKSLKNTLSKTLRRMGQAAPHWQERFFDHLLRSEEPYQEKWRYVRENPVGAGLVLRWEDWPYRGEVHQLELRL